MRFLLTRITSLLCLYFLAASFVQAENIDCPIKEVATGKQYKWRVTNMSCPAGSGMWGKKPKKMQGTFWVQCAYTKKIPGSWFLDLLSKVASEDQIVLRKELNQYRCLIGPFSLYTEAMVMVMMMKKHEKLKQAFVREVKGDKIAVSNAPQPALTPAKPKKPARPVIAAPVEPTASAMDKALDTMTPPQSTIFSDKKTPNPASWTREFYQIGGYYSPVPRDNEPSYVEMEKKWLRAPYSEAEKICTENGMEVVSSDNLQIDVESENFKAKLPKRLPYWVQDKLTFDIVMMVPVSLTENSAIYVLCE